MILTANTKANSYPSTLNRGFSHEEKPTEAQIRDSPNLGHVSGKICEHRAEE